MMKNHKLANLNPFYFSSLYLQIVKKEELLGKYLISANRYY